jgi:hypothetical protein
VTTPMPLLNLERGALDRSEIYALKLECYPLRILLPDREIRQGGISSGRDRLFNMNAKSTRVDSFLTILFCKEWCSEKALF